MSKVVWRVWVDDSHLLTSFETEDKAKEWVKRYAPECIIKPFNLDEEN